MISQRIFTQSSDGEDRFKAAIVARRSSRCALAHTLCASPNRQLTLGKKACGKDNDGEGLANRWENVALSAISGIHSSGHQADANRQLNQVEAALGPVSACLSRWNSV